MLYDAFLETRIIICSAGHLVEKYYDVSKYSEDEAIQSWNLEMSENSCRE